MTTPNDDTRLLEDLIESGKLSEDQETAFNRMLEDLRSGKFRSLTERQKEWVKGVHARLGLDPGVENLVSSGKVKVTEQERKSLNAFFDSLGPKPKKPPRPKPQE